MDLAELTTFIVRAKAATYVGDGQRAEPSRSGSHDLVFQEGDWSYRDSYFGGRDFIGQEVVYHVGKPVGSMNYYGRILRADLITPDQAGRVIKASLTGMYKQGRFLGGCEHRHEEFIYHDSNSGDTASFMGTETIERQGVTAYQLVYHGGLIKDE